MEIKLLRSRKAQITVFIIVGIILLFSSALVFYIKQRVSEGTPPLEEVVEEVPIEAQPVKLFVEGCVKQAAIDAIKMLGKNGGYIGTSRDDYKYTKQNFRVNDFDSTNADVLTFAPNSEYRIPYWWYLASSNRCGEGAFGNCYFSSMMPPLRRNERSLVVGSDSSIEVQIDNYINQNLGSCLEGLSSLEEKGYAVTFTGNASAKTTVGKNDVTVILTYPMEVTKEGRVSKLSKFISQVPVELSKMYELAAAITFLEMQSYFIDNHALNIIASYALNIDEDLLPPMSASNFEPGSYTMWTEQDTQEKLKSLFTSYVPMLQAYLTKNYARRDTGDDLVDALYFATIPVSVLTNKTYEKFSTSFVYIPWWPIYLNVKGSGVSGAAIRPQSFYTPGPMGVFSWFGLQKYDFYYDVSFPVVIEIRDAEAFNKEGYTLRFAIESNIKENQPLTVNFSSTPLFYPTQGSFFTRENQRNSGDVIIDTVNAQTDAPEEDVQVMFSCGEESILVGWTKLDNDPSSPTYGKAVVKSKLPTGCAGTVLVYNKAGFLTAPQQFAVGYGEGKNVTLELKPFKELSVSVIKKRMKKECSPIISEKEWTFDPEPVAMARVEEAIISLERIKRTAAEEDYSATVDLLGNDTEKQKMLLVPGKYSLDITLIYNRPVFFAGETKHIPGIPFISEDTEINIPDVEFNESFPEGGFLMDNTTAGYWEIGNEIYDADEIVFYVIASPGECFNNLNHYDLDQIGRMEELSIAYKEQLIPQFI